MKVLFLSDFVPVKNIKLDESFIKLVKCADKVIFNLEGSPLSNSADDCPNQIMPFKVEDLFSFLKMFDKYKFSIALANNHIFDNGQYGFDYLINKLDDLQISYFGTKEKPFVEINEDLAILNFVTAETVASYSSRSKLNYLFYDPSEINRQIKELENQNTNLILYPHWGRDMDRTVFNTYDLKLSINKWHIFGHHPHVISGIGKNKIYSLGNTFIPHPYYYKRYPAMRYGLAVIYDNNTQDYTTKITEVVSEDGFENDFTLRTKAFDEIPIEVLNHGVNYSFLKKKYHKILSFTGNRSDLIKLVILQAMTKVFEFRRKFLKD
jgi:hypothetical protein